MENKLKDIIIKFRAFLYGQGQGNVSLDRLCEEINMEKKDVLKYVSSEEELVEKVLEYERKGFEEIFLEYDFEGVNAIDILLTVSREVSRKFKDVSPAVTINLEKYYPDIYQKHFTYRTDFIYDKIKINLKKGIMQKMYRSDLSIELIARLYLARLIDIHDSDFFPPEEFSFETLFNVMFENFLRSICLPEGLKYYEKKKKQFKF